MTAALGTAPTGGTVYFRIGAMAVPPAAVPSEYRVQTPTVVAACIVELACCRAVKALCAAFASACAVAW